MNSELVIRPSGVWNTRSPLIQFIEHHRRINKTYFTLLLAIEHLRDDLNIYDRNLKTVELFNNSGVADRTRRAFKSYRKSFPSEADLTKPEPLVIDLLTSISSLIGAATEHAIVSYGALFETFSQCWALNYLLAILENGEEWQESQKRLAIRFSPLEGRHVPGWPEICRAFPFIEEELCKVPHIFTHPQSGKPVDAPITQNLNAFTAIQFWRSWRNLIVHSSGMVSNRFYNAHFAFWQDFKAVYTNISDFEVGKRLVLDDRTFRAMTTVHYRAAKSLRSLLVKVSRERRGHVLAPNPEWGNGPMPPELLPASFPPMLIEGDHAASFQWINDPEFRAKLAGNEPRHNN